MIYQGDAKEGEKTWVGRRRPRVPLEREREESLICAGFRADAHKSANVCKFQHAQVAKQQWIRGDMVYIGVLWRIMVDAGV